MTRAPTEDEMRLAKAGYVAAIENGWAEFQHLAKSKDDYLRDNAWENQSPLLHVHWLAVVRAIIDGIRPMTERQWETLPGLGKPWKDRSSREVWECFLECISPRESK